MKRFAKETSRKLQWQTLHSHHLTPHTFLSPSHYPCLSLFFFFICSVSLSLPQPHFSFGFFSFSVMKLMKVNPKQLSLSLSPKRLFRSKKDRSAVSRSDPPSFGSGTASSSSASSSDSLPSNNHKIGTATAACGMGTPTSVLPEISGDWSDFSADNHLDMAQAFKLIDRDNDGMVSRKELEALLKRLGAQPPSHEEVTVMLSEVDRDGDGCIPLEALLHRFGPVCEPAADSELREAFEVFDRDHDGKISAEELFSVFSAIGDDGCTLEDCRRMIAEVDKNGDGFVCFEDFARMMELQR